MKLSRKARRVKKMYLDGYDFSDQGGKDVLEKAMEHHTRMDQAEAILERDGLVVTDRFNQLREHPMINVARKERVAYLHAIRQLGLDILPENHVIGRPPER